MTIQMKGTKQLEREIITEVPLPRIWAVLADSRLLPKWAAAVEHVDSCDAGGEAVGAVRHCQVKLGGRAGRMVERCVGMIENQEIAYVVDDDTFGMSRMFADYGFKISLSAKGAATSVRIETFYTPKNFVYGAMNALVLRRQFRGVVDQLLSGLVGFATTHERPSGNIAPIAS